jgi:hypothetical protein
MDNPKALVDSPTTLMDIEFDVDTYVANGGQLLDLMLIPSLKDRARVLRWIETVDEETRARVARVGEFAKLIGSQCEPDETVESRFTEEQLRELWQKTASANRSGQLH